MELSKPVRILIAALVPSLLYAIPLSIDGSRAMLGAHLYPLLSKLHINQELAFLAVTVGGTACLHILSAVAIYVVMSGTRSAQVLGAIFLLGLIPIFSHYTSLIRSVTVALRTANTDASSTQYQLQELCAIPEATLIPLRSDFRKQRTSFFVLSANGDQRRIFEVPIGTCTPREIAKQVAGSNLRIQVASNDRVLLTTDREWILLSPTRNIEITPFAKALVTLAEEGETLYWVAEHAGLIEPTSTIQFVQYDIASRKKTSRTLEAPSQELPLEKVSIIHASDKRDELAFLSAPHTLVLASRTGELTWGPGNIRQHVRGTSWTAIPGLSKRLADGWLVMLQNTATGETSLEWSLRGASGFFTPPPGERILATASNPQGSTLAISTERISGDQSNYASVQFISLRNSNVLFKRQLRYPSPAVELLPNSLLNYTLALPGELRAVVAQIR